MSCAERLTKFGILIRNVFPEETGSRTKFVSTAESNSFGGHKPQAIN